MGWVKQIDHKCPLEIEKYNQGKIFELNSLFMISSQNDSRPPKANGSRDGS